MKFGVRKPSIKRSIKARTTGRVKRQMKRSVNPFYGSKGLGYVKDPKKAVYNNIYNRTSVSILPSSAGAPVQKTKAKPFSLMWKDDDGNIINIFEDKILYKPVDGTLVTLDFDNLSKVYVDEDWVFYADSKDESPCFSIQVPSAERKAVSKLFGVEVPSTWENIKVVFAFIWAIIQLIFYLSLIVGMIAFLLWVFFS